MFSGPFGHSIIKRAQDENIVQFFYHQLRRWGVGKHRLVDDRPFGGGSGMILRVDVIAKALDAIRSQEPNTRTILLDPRGRPYDQIKAKDLANQESLTLICGHYEGVDERVHAHLADEIISIGNYVLTGGEIAAMVVVDTIVRLLPGVLGSETAAEEDSFSYRIRNVGDQGPLLEYPQFTQPREFRGWAVPEILLSGNHRLIQNWREEHALKTTKRWRPDLLRHEGIAAPRGGRTSKRFKS
jgi:tRNA (guanine37-N1)-methyltransferase